MRVYPVTEYCLFTMFFVAFGFLVYAWTTRISRTGGAILAILLATFYPFIHDAFFPDTDALLIPLFALTVGICVLWCRPQGASRWVLALVGTGVVWWGMSLKWTSLVYVVLVPLLVYMADTDAPRRSKVLGAATALVATVLLIPLGSWAGSLYQHPNRNVGVGDLQFQETAIWHVMWGGAGHMDPYTAFGFTSSGRLRNERVGDVLGIEADTYLRQAQAATEKVYRPGIIEALEEMPSIFYSNAFHRFQRYTLRFYSYNTGTGGLIEPWTKPSEARVDYLDGKEASPGEHRADRVLESVRLDRYWRIAPLVLLARIQQEWLPRFMDVAILGIAASGIIVVPVRGLRWFLGLALVMQLGMTTFVHGLVRYGAFLNVAGLVGLAAFLEAAWGALRLGSKAGVPDYQHEPRP